MNWYKIRVSEGGTVRNYDGSSELSFEGLAEKAARGEYIRLDNLRYWDQRDGIKDWAEWDENVVASVYLNPSIITMIQPYKSDPLTVKRTING